MIQLFEKQLPKISGHTSAFIRKDKTFAAYSEIF